MESRKKRRYGLLVILFMQMFAGTTAAAVIDRLVISELFYDRVGSDNGFEWLELFNGGPIDIELSTWSIGYGGSSFVAGSIGLSGVIRSGEYYVLGGPQSDISNHSPVFDLAVDLSPDLQNSGAIADGVGLFNVPVENLSATTVPLDVLIYGGANDSLLLGVDGLVSIVHSPDVTNGQSIERLTEIIWAPSSNPNPGSGALTKASSNPNPNPQTPVAAPGTLVLTLVAMIIAGLRSMLGRRRLRSGLNSHLLMPAS